MGWLALVAPLVLALVAPLVLALAGAALVRHCRVSRLRTGAATGALVAVGYAPVAMATAIGSAWAPHGTDIVFAPAFVDTVLLTGLFVPVVFGGLGGAIATLVPVGVPAFTDSLPRL